MKNVKISIFYAIVITSTAESVFWNPAGTEAVKEAAKVATIIIDKTVPILSAESAKLTETILVVSERTGVSVDKMTVVVDKLGTGMIYVAAAGVTIYSIKLVCNAGCTVKSSLWPSEEEIQAKLAQCIETEKRIKLIREEIKMLDAKATFEQCLDKHIEKPGFPEACENAARAYAKFNRYNEVNSIKAFFNQSR